MTGAQHHQIEALAKQRGYTTLEDYPDDKYGLSCLLLGYTTPDKPLHIQVSYPPKVKLSLFMNPHPMNGKRI